MLGRHRLSIVEQNPLAKGESVGQSVFRHLDVFGQHRTDGQVVLVADQTFDNVEMN